MDLQTYLDMIANSHFDDWTRVHQPLYLAAISSGESGDGRKWVETEHPHLIATYKRDLSVSMAIGLQDSQWECVEDEWVKRFPDPTAWLYWLDFLFNGVQVLRTPIVVVNGGRAGLPMPERDTMIVPHRLFQVAKLVDQLQGGQDFNLSFSRAEMKIADHPWPEPE